MTVMDLALINPQMILRPTFFQVGDERLATFINQSAVKRYPHMSLFAKLGCCLLVLILLPTSATAKYDCFYDPETGDYDLCDAQEFTLAVLKHAKEFLGEEDGRFSERWYALSEATNSYEMDETASSAGLYFQTVYDDVRDALLSSRPCLVSWKTIPCGAVNIRFEKKVGERLGRALPIVRITSTGSTKKEFCEVEEGAHAEAEVVNERHAFLVSDGDWRAVLGLVPVAIYTDENGVIHRNPVLVYHEDEGNFDADSIIYFLQQYPPEKLTMVGDTPRALDDFLEAPADAGAGLEGKTERISPSDYLSFWNAEFDEVVVADEDEYEDALLASVYASYIHAPLVFVDFDSVSLWEKIKARLGFGYSRLFRDRDVYMIGEHARESTLGGTISDFSPRKVTFYTPAELRAEYVRSTGTNKVIMVNARDMIDVSEEWGERAQEEMEREEESKVFYPFGVYDWLTPDRSPFSFKTMLYAKTSLAAPILAASKHEVIIPVDSVVYERVDEEFTAMFSETTAEASGFDLGERNAYTCSPSDSSCSSGFIEGRDSVTYSRGSVKLILDVGNKPTEMELKGRYVGFDFTFEGRFVCDEKRHLRDFDLYINDERVEKLESRYTYHYAICLSRGDIGELRPASDLHTLYIPFAFENREDFPSEKVRVELRFLDEDGVVDEDVMVTPNLMELHLIEDQAAATDEDESWAIYPLSSCDIGGLRSCLVDYRVFSDKVTYAKPTTGATLEFTVRNPEVDHTLNIDMAGEGALIWMTVNGKTFIERGNYMGPGNKFVRTKFVIPAEMLRNGANTITFYYEQDEDSSGMRNRLFLRNAELVEGVPSWSLHYLTIMASPTAVEMARYAETDEEGNVFRKEVDSLVYGSLRNDDYVDFAVGRIFGFTTSDTSAYVARSVFFDELPKSRKALLMFAGYNAEDTEKDVVGNFRYKDILKNFDESEGGDGYKTCFTYTGCSGNDMDECFKEYYLSSGLVFHKGHGAYGGGMSRGTDSFSSQDLKDWKATLKAPFIATDGCHTCAFDDEPSENLFCMQNVRRGAIAYYGSVSTGYGTHFKEVLYGVYFDGKSAGEASRHWKNAEKTYGRGNARYYCILIGDPTLKPKWW
jgi:hypothetical protein